MESNELRSKKHRRMVATVNMTSTKENKIQLTINDHQEVYNSPGMKTKIRLI